MKIIIILLAFLLNSCLMTTSFLIDDVINPEQNKKTFQTIIIEEDPKTTSENPRIIKSDYFAFDFSEIVSYNYLCIETTKTDALSTNDIKKKCLQNEATIVLYNQILTRDFEYDRSEKGRVAGNIEKKYNYTICYFRQNATKPKFGWELRDSNIQESTGAFVYLVYKNSAIFFARIMNGDIIVRINEHKIKNVADYNAIYDYFDTGDEVEVEFMRSNKRHIVNIKLE